MNYRKYFKKLITGLTVHQQYVCLAFESLEYPLSVKLSVEGKSPAWDVTHSHVFLGYKPVVIGLCFTGENDRSVLAKESLVLQFYPNNSSESIALLKLRRCREQFEGVPLILYEAVMGNHTFIGFFYRFINRLREKFRKESLSNITLLGNERDQVRIAYAVPRIISLITVGRENLMNMFPTDLHGPVNSSYYASSLRIGGKADAQVAQAGRIVLSQMKADYFRDVYLLGKNHMKEMKVPNLFDNLSTFRSKVFNLSLPAGVIRYRELEVVNSCVIGIHHIYVYKEVHKAVMNEGMTLAHVDQYYAQWREDHGLPANLLIR